VAAGPCEIDPARDVRGGWMRKLTFHEVAEATPTLRVLLRVALSARERRLRGPVELTLD